jgi:hypothetical protein
MRERSSAPAKGRYRQRMEATVRVVGLIVVFVLAGCSSGGSSGTPPMDAGQDGPVDAGEDAPPDAGASDCGGLVWKSQACTACTHQQCCSVEQLCAAIPSCAPLDACWNACGGDGGCQNGCGAQYIAAISNFNAILNCQNNACNSACKP